MRYTRPLIVLFISLCCITCREVDNVTPNTPPVADAGDDMDALAGATVALNGENSSDADDDALSFTWTLIETPQQSQVSINDFDSVHATFTPDLAGLYRIKLVVTDNVATDADTLVVSVTNPNGAPVANAGADAKANLGVSFQLSGNATDPDGDQLTYSWALIGQPAGSNAVLQNPGSKNASFTPDRPGIYNARLTVSDGLFTSVDDVAISTNDVNITAILPTSGASGITVKISGTNFSNVIAENIVKFNGTAAVVSTASYTNLDVIVPVAAGTGSVTVTVNGVTDTGPIFTYVPTAIVSTITQFAGGYFMTSDPAGNLYISDYTNHVIRKLTPQGQLSVIAGTGQEGYADSQDPLQAMFHNPTGIVLSGNDLYVADRLNHVIRKISLLNGNVSTFAGFPQAGYADGQGMQAQFNLPHGLGIDAAGNLYVGDLGNYRIRLITPDATVSTLAGNGQQGFADGAGQNAQFAGIGGVAVDADNIIYIADALNQRIRKMTVQGVVSTLAGDGTAGLLNGTGASARFNTPFDVSCDAAGNVYVSDFDNHCIRKVTPHGIVSTVAGNGTPGTADGSGTVARFNNPIGVHAGVPGKIYVADFGNDLIRLIEFE